MKLPNQCFKTSETLWKLSGDALYGYSDHSNHKSVLNDVDRNIGLDKISVLGILLIDLNSYCQ